MLEAHILASLVDSGSCLLCAIPAHLTVKIQSNISFASGTQSNLGLIWRHTVCGFCKLMRLLRELTSTLTALSMDSERGKNLFKFDRSLMERLADNGFPMSQINVQRRMRPTISHHIRYRLLLLRKTHHLDLLLQNDPVPEVGGQRSCEAIS